MAMTTASASTLSPLSSTTPCTAPSGRRISEATVPCRSVAPCASAAFIKPVVKARGSTSAVVSGEPSRPVISTRPDSHGRGAELRTRPFSAACPA